MPPPDVRLWAALLYAKIDLSGLVDPVEKDEEEAKAEYGSGGPIAQTSLTMYQERMAGHTGRATSAADG